MYEYLYSIQTHTVTHFVHISVVVATQCEPNDAGNPVASSFSFILEFYNFSNFSFYHTICSVVVVVKASKCICRETIPGV